MKKLAMAMMLGVAALSANAQVNYLSLIHI